MKRIILLSVIVVSILGLFMSGCTTPTKPYFEDSKVKAEPTFLRPDDTNGRLVLHYTIQNPTSLDFSGKVSYKYNEDCIRIYNQETEVNIPLGEDDSYSVDVVPTGVRNYDEDCYGTQTILLVLSNAEGTLIYDSQSVEISVTR